MNESKWLDEFGDNLRALMREEGQTQRTLSAKSGIGKSSINRYLTGRSMPSCKAIINLSEALNCTPDDLIDFGERID